MQLFGCVFPSSQVMLCTSLFVSHLPVEEVTEGGKDMSLEQSSGLCRETVLQTGEAIISKTSSGYLPKCGD